MREPLPGDVIFAHGKGFIARAIQFGELLRWKRGRRWNHAAIVAEVRPGQVRVIQAEGHGVTSTWMRSVAEVGSVVELVPCPAADWQRVVEFAEAQIHDDYGFLSILSIAISIVAPWFLTIRQPGTWVCSALAGECLRAGGWLHDWPDVYQVSPAQLYEAVQNGTRGV